MTQTVPQITVATFTEIAPQAKAAIAVGLAQYINPAFAHFSIPTHQAVYFLGQAAEETDGFRSLVEYASGKEYNGRADLGNGPDDGPTFKGRGIFQLTGRFNYRKYGHKLGVDFEDHPEFAALPQYAVLTACQYWVDHDIGPDAEANDIKTVTKKINGGYRGLPDRVAYTRRAAKALGQKIPL